MIFGRIDRHLRGLSGLAGDVRNRRFGEKLGEVDQIRRPDAVKSPLELPNRDRLDRE